VTRPCQTLGMRWTLLFDDLEAQLDGQERAELLLEVAEHVRAERGQVSLPDRLVVCAGAEVSLRVRGVGSVRGTVAEVGSGWLVLRTSPEGADRRRDLLVPLTAVLMATGLPTRSDSRDTVAQRRLDLRHALRALSRDRAVVRLTDVEGGQVTGTIDRVGLDHLDLADHPDDVPRRDLAVRSTHAVPFAAVAAIRQI
jgi:hypothetical protein